MRNLSLVRKYILYCFCTFVTISLILIIGLTYSINRNLGTWEIHKVIWGTMFLGLILHCSFLIKSLNNISNKLVKQNKELTESKKLMEEALKKLDYSYRETITAASITIDARDPYTAGHSKRVADMSCKIGKKIGLSEKDIECLELAALFHDIGKIGIPDHILHKAGSLDDEEFNKIKSHPILGYDILKSIEFFSSILPLILYHHERQDGMGYPQGLKGDEIPIGAAIIAIADTYDAMTSDRPYRKALPQEVAIKEISDKSGTQFKKELVEAFLKLVL